MTESTLINESDLHVKSDHEDDGNGYEWRPFRKVANSYCPGVYFVDCPRIQPLHNTTYEYAFSCSKGSADSLRKVIARAKVKNCI
jgi:hypothetical protein